MSAQVKIARIVKSRSTGESLIDKNEKQYYVVVGEESLIDTPAGPQLTNPTSLLYNTELGDKIATMIEAGTPVFMAA